MTNFKEKYEQIKRDNIISSDNEAEMAFQFVANVLELSANRTRQMEPYATNSIRRLEAMESEIYSFLDNFLEELEEDD